MSRETRQKLPLRLFALAPLRAPAALVALVALAGMLACGGGQRSPVPAQDCTQPSAWAQWGGGASHQGLVCARGQSLSSALEDITYDPFVVDEKAETGGDLLAHYQSPLLSGSDVYLEVKTGNYRACTPAGSGAPAPCGSDAWSQEIWTERRYSWSPAGKLEPVWRFDSDWKPVPDQGYLGEWEPVFHAALTASAIWVPGFGGSVVLVDANTGGQLLRVNPFASDPNTYVISPLTADAQGNVVYSALTVDPSNIWGADAHGFLVKAGTSGIFQVASFDHLLDASGAPANTDLCEAGYAFDRHNPPALPLLNPDGSVAPARTRICGSQRPGLNLAPAIGADGAIFLATRAHTAGRSSFLVALNGDLTLRWATSLRGLFHDGCGVLVPEDEQPLHCHKGVPQGIDPFTGTAPSGVVEDDSTASPVVLPDGAVLYGVYTGYNGARGHLLKFSATGKPSASYDFGWDTTPAFFAHDGTYSIVLKDNHYDTKGPYYITQLDANLAVEWHWNSDNTKACTRAGDGSISCKDDHPGGFEWCVNEVAIDKDGTVYANSEDGFLYAIEQGGHEKQRLFLLSALGAAYTPLSIDVAGRIYTQNSGHLFVVGGN